MARRWLYATVTCHCRGNTHSKGYRFKHEIPKEIKSSAHVDGFRGHPWFSVLDYWYDDIEKFSAIEEEEKEPVKELEVENSVVDEPEVEVPKKKLEEEPEKEEVKEPVKVMKKKMAKKKVLRKKEVKKD